MADDIPNLFLRLTILVATFCLSGFFSGSETALFSIPPEELSRMRESSGVDRIAALLRDTPKRLLITVLFGNMLVNVIFYSVSYLLAVDLHPRLGDTGTFLLGLAALLAVILGGEVMPKNLAVLSYRRFARVAAFPLYVLQKTLFLIVLPLEKLVDYAAVLAGGGRGPAMMPEELRTLVSLSARQGVLEPGAGQMLAEVISLSDVRVRELMVPRVQMVAFDLGDPVEDLLELFRREKLTTIPAYRGRVENMRGVIHIKDVLFGRGEEPLETCVRPVPFLPETATVEEALNLCRKEASKTAFVIDEYGSVAGLVTIEDLLEEIVGEIADEYDRERPPDVALTEDGRFRVKGDLAVREWEELLGVELPEAEVDTVGGLVMATLERLPREGETVRIGDTEFTVERMAGRRVDSLLVSFRPEEREGGDGD
ncbi:MAG: hemolysin family protein [Planctomycetota bacterium]